MTSDQEKKGILGIENRTENWKTARTFARMYPENVASLANSLLKPYGTSSDLNSRIIEPGEARLELFWKGIRDYLHAQKAKRRELMDRFASLYNHAFEGLYDQFKSFCETSDDAPAKQALRFLSSQNYSVSDGASKEGLFNNLRNTEFDIIIESPNHLFIGEAKGEMGLGAQGNLVLVHQLIRQFVTARVLLDHLNETKTIVPFIVWDRPDSKRRDVQVRFMIDQCWLKKENILSWSRVERSAGVHIQKPHVTHA